MIELTRHELPSKDGFDLEVHLEQDYEISIWDVSGAYSPADIDAYQRFEWMYCLSA